MTSRTIQVVASVAVVVFISKLLGLLREMVIARQFGTSPDYDLYLLAVMLPALLAGVLGFASYYLAVPYLTRLFLASPDKHATRLGVWSLFNGTLVAGVALTIVSVLVAPYVMRIWTTGFDDLQFARILFYSRVTAVIILLTATEAALRAALNARSIVASPSAGFILFNLVSIGTMLLVSRQFGTGAIAYGLIGGLLAQNLLLAGRLWIGDIIPRFSAAFITPDTRLLFVTAGLLIVTELVNRSYFLIDRYFAPTFGPGIISALNYGQVVVQLPDAIVGFSIASVLFPLFAEHSAEQDAARFSYLYQRAIIGGLLVAVPLAVFFYANAADLVQLLFRRGAFDSASSTMTAAVLRPYTPTIAALFVISTSIRASYAQGWVRHVLALTFFALLLKFAATPLLSEPMGYAGISAATTVSQLTLALALIWLVIAKAKVKNIPAFLSQLARLILIAGICAVILYFVNPALAHLCQGTDWLSAFGRVALSAVCLAVLFVVLSSLSGFREYIRQMMFLGHRST